MTTTGSPGLDGCDHMQIDSECRVVLLDGTGHRIAEFSVRCARCGIPFHFLGAPTGLSMAKPTVDVPGTTLHAPIRAGGRTLADMPNRITFSDLPKLPD